jgi:hypothetical protein
MRGASPWAWAEEHIGSIPYSPIPGRFRSENSPQIREPLEAVVDPKVRLVFIVAAIQSGKTSVGEIGLCHTTDMREWMFQCLKCGARQPWSWDQIEWSKSARDEHGEWDYAEVRRTTSMRCAICNHYFDDSDRTRRELNATGRFIPQNSRAAKESVGFHWNALCTMSWGALAELYLRAKSIARRGDISALKQF